MKIVAITACATGIAQTYMAAERLKKAAAEMGHTIRVETQGALGVENALTAAEVAGSDVVIIASEISIEGIERFRHKRCVEVPIQAAVRDAMAVLRKL
jgi:fructose-specific phosphotransferase system IIB component